MSEIDEMIRMLEMKKKELVEFIDMEKTSKIKTVREQVTSMSTKIQKTTGLLQFCVETLKEQDPSSFLQVKLRTLFCQFSLSLSKKISNNYILPFFFKLDL